MNRAETSVGRNVLGGSSPRQWRAAGLLAVSALTTVSALGDLHWWGRPLLTLGFFLLVPGVAIVSSFELDDALAELTLGAAVSISVSTAAAMVMLWCHAWHPLAAELLLALLTAPLLVAQVLDRRLAGRVPGRDDGPEPPAHRSEARS